MSFDRASLGEHARNGPVARVVVARTSGSVPREVGASLVVGRDGLLSGTIGGGALEHQAIARATEALAAGSDRIDRVPLGPSIGQCCGGAVTLLTEVWDAERLAALTGEIVARPLPEASNVPPLAVTRLLAKWRDGREATRPTLLADWFLEPVSRSDRNIWVWGAGHVGRAIVGALAPLPDLAMTWADTHADRFPDRMPEGVRRLVAANPADLVTHAPPSAEHYVLTYSHALDLEICHRVLLQRFSFLGLIGSDTKRARFRSRLGALGHSDAAIARLSCPIGDPSLGKHPQEIALGVALEILQRRDTGDSMVRASG